MKGEVMYVAVFESGHMHQLLRLSKHDFERLSQNKFVSAPVYFYESEDNKVSVWPLAESGIRIYRLEPQAVTEFTK